MGEVPAPRRSPTYPAPKYGPTADFGTCEMLKCNFAARTLCEECGGHYCLGHHEHATHTRS
jgi:hypothetical protein